MVRSDECSTWPLATLTSAFCPDFDPQRLTMAICVGYFEANDGAGTRTSFTVSGLVSSKSKWRQFESLWTRALRHEDLSSFNAREFADDPARQRRLLDALTRVIEQHVLCAFSCSLPLGDYEQIDAEYAFHETVAGPYGICSGLLLIDVRRWMALHHPDNLTLCVFEDGDMDHRELRRVVSADWADSGEPAQLWPRQWIDEHGRRRHLRPFEACDLFATEGARALVNRLADRDRYFRRVVDQDDLLRLCETLGVRRRVDEAATAQMAQVSRA